MRRFCEVRRRASGEGFEGMMVFFNVFFIVIEINCVQSKELIEGSVYRHVSVLELLSQNLYLPKKSKVTLQNWKDLLRYKENCRPYLSLRMNIMLSNLPLKVLQAVHSVIRQFLRLLISRQKVNIYSKK